MWKIMQLDEPQDIVIATGETHTVKEFCEEAFNCIGKNWLDYTEYDNEKDLRPAELDWLRGDSSKATELIGWKPTINFKGLVKRMVNNDIKLLNKTRFGQNSRH
jgi:GDPmannose 4,6-dehydratase